MLEQRLLGPSTQTQGATPAVATAAGGGRIAYLDGLRGIAILLVILHHAFGAWHVMNARIVHHEPYPENITMFPLVAYGYLGVQLFFFVSGFVIFRSLNNCISFPRFMWKRWLRLFPAMLFCSLLIYFTSSIFTERLWPATVSFRALLPGVTFIEPAWWEYLLNSPQGAIEGVFWSLYTEVRFYMVFGLAYFYLGRRWAIGILLAIFCIGMWIGLRYLVLPLQHIPAYASLTGMTDQAITWLVDANLYTTASDSLQYGCFAGGIFFARYYETRRRRYLAAALVLGFVSAVVVANRNPYTWVGVDYPAIAIALVLLVVVPALIATTFGQKLFSARLLVFFGFVSYPLYLFHQNVLVASIVKMQAAFPEWPILALPILPFICEVAVAWIIARWIEPRIRDVIKKIFPWGATKIVSSSTAAA